MAATIPERLARIEALIEEGIPQRSRLISAVERLHSDLSDLKTELVSVPARVDNVELNVVELRKDLKDLQAGYNKAVGMGSILGAAGGGILTLVITELKALI